jgi:hypothetical protein
MAFRRKLTPSPREQNEEGCWIPGEGSLGKWGCLGPRRDLGTSQGGGRKEGRPQGTQGLLPGRSPCPGEGSFLFLLLRLPPLIFYSHEMLCSLLFSLLSPGAGGTQASPDTGLGLAGLPSPSMCRARGQKREVSPKSRVGLRGWLDGEGPDLPTGEVSAGQRVRQVWI